MPAHLYHGKQSRSSLPGLLPPLTDWGHRLTHSRNIHNVLKRLHSWDPTGILISICITNTTFTVGVMDQSSLKPTAKASSRITNTIFTSSNLLSSGRTLLYPPSLCAQVWGCLLITTNFCRREPQRHHNMGYI